MQPSGEFPCRILAWTMNNLIVLSGTKHFEVEEKEEQHEWKMAVVNHTNNPIQYFICPLLEIRLFEVF